MNVVQYIQNRPHPILDALFIWVAIALVFHLITTIRAKSRYDKADHILNWLLLPAWFPLLFSVMILRKLFWKDNLNNFWKTVRNSLFPCLLLISLAGKAGGKSTGPDTLRLNHKTHTDTTYILPCTWRCSCDTTIYGGWLIEVGGKYSYKQGYRKNYNGHWTQYAIPVKENRCRRSNQIPQ